MTVAEKAKASAEQIQTDIENLRDYQYRKFLRMSDNAYMKQIAPVLQVADKVSPELWPVDSLSPIPIIDLFSALYPTVGVYFAKYANRSMKSIIGELKTKDRADDLEPMWQQMIRQYVFTSVADRVQGITEYTRTGIRDVVNYCITNGLSIENSAKYLKSKVNGIGISRARTITRTEILTASNYGQYIGYKSLDIPLEKVWLTARDERVRRQRYNHEAANGQKRGLDDYFDVSGEKMLHPGDPNGSTGNVVRCRCTMFSQPI